MKDDLLVDCNHLQADPDQFVEVFCQRCKNPECRRAAFGSPRMEQRVRDQEQRLLHPERADHTLAKYAHIVEAEFKSMLHRAVQLEIADQRGDWEIPEIPVLDGQVHVAPADAVDAAIKAMAKPKLQMEPTEETSLDPPENDFSEEPLPSVAEEGAEEAEGVQEAPPQDPGSKPPIVRPTGHNTATPQGVILGDEPLPELEPAHDPWAVPEGPVAKKVEVGATVKMGGD